MLLIEENQNRWEEDIVYFHWYYQRPEQKKSLFLSKIPCVRSMERVNICETMSGRV
jgi:hypothetical protein